MCKCGITGHFARVCRGGTRRQAGQQQFNFVSEDTNEGAFVTECDTTPQFARKYFANLHLIHGEKTKVVKVQICVYCDVVFPIKVMVPLIHARDNGKTFFFNLSLILLSVVQPV